MKLWCLTSKNKKNKEKQTETKGPGERHEADQQTHMGAPEEKERRRKRLLEKQGITKNKQTKRLFEEIVAKTSLN